MEKYEEVAQKMIDVLEKESLGAPWSEGAMISLYVGSKLLLGFFDACKDKKDYVGIVFIMRVRDEIVKRFNSLSAEDMEIIERLKKTIPNKDDN